MSATKYTQVLSLSSTRRVNNNVNIFEISGYPHRKQTATTLQRLAG